MLNNDLSKGLPPNLAVGEPSIDYGFKGVDISMTSYQSELQWLSNTVTNNVLSCDLSNQSVNSLALVSGRATEKAIEVL
jgi:phenylalanine ammonia-lyase